MKKTFTFHTRSRLWILCAAVCMVWAVPLHAQTRRISLNLKNATIQQAVIALQQQGYSLSVKADDVDMKAPVDIHARNEELQAVKAFTDVVAEQMKNGEKVQLVGFGTFETSERAAREGRNPQTGETMTIKASKTPKFKAGKALKDMMN